MEKAYLAVQAVASGIGAWISAKLGILFPMLGLLVLCMFVDYISGMAASKSEAIDHPDDPEYGWSSKKGLKGILKKFGYMLVITAGMVFDFIIVNAAQNLNIDITLKAYFALALTIWYILNEILSIIENAGRMGANVPEWLSKYVAVIKGKIDQEGEEHDGSDQNIRE